MMVIESWRCTNLGVKTHDDAMYQVDTLRHRPWD
jgi:hypothetical protein